MEGPEVTYRSLSGADHTLLVAPGGPFSAAHDRAEALGSLRARASGLVVAAKGTFLLSALILGQEAVRRYRRLLDLRNWFGKKPD